VVVVVMQLVMMTAALVGRVVHDESVPVSVQLSLRRQLPAV